MRPDGDPDRDDYGLPHVDVVVPDDARELDRDLIAYRREERQRRRRQRLRRLVRPLTRYGVAAPIIALALLIAVVSGALLTTLGPRPIPSPTTSTQPSGALSPSSSPGVAGGPLPGGTVTYGGAVHQIDEELQGIVALIPQNCGCDETIKALAARALQYDLKWFLVGAGSPDKAQLDRLTTAAGPGAISAVDQQGVLSSTYHASGLTVLLVHTDHVVRQIMRDLKADGLPAAVDLDKLRGPGAGVLTPRA